MTANKTFLESLSSDSKVNEKQDLLVVSNAPQVLDSWVMPSTVLTAAAPPGIELTGNNGNNKLTGTTGNDTLKGLGGNDRLYGQKRNDRLDGDSGKDRLYGRDGGDTLSGGGGDDQLYGNAGNDSLKGGIGADKLVGSDGQDSLYGEDGEDRLIGDNGQDTLNGGSGRDTLVGGGAADVLIGGLDNDTLTGGDGKDVFRYQSFDDREDTISDFDDDKDRLDLRQLFSGSNYSDSDPFKEYLVIVNDEDENTIIRVDADGDSGDKPFKTLVTLADVDFDNIGRSNFIL